MRRRTALQVIASTLLPLFGGSGASAGAFSNSGYRCRYWFAARRTSSCNCQARSSGKPSRPVAFKFNGDGALSRAFEKPPAVEHGVRL
jgi:hypothetical protein